MSSLVAHCDPTFTFASSLRRDRPTSLRGRFALLSRAPSAARAAGHDARLTFLAPRSKILLITRLFTRSKPGAHHGTFHDPAGSTRRSRPASAHIRPGGTATTHPL